MELSDVGPHLAYSELKVVLYENSEPWDSIAQCRLFLRAASILRHKEPLETEHDNERISTRDLEDMMKHCRRAMNVLSYTNSTATVIVPTDDLR